MRFTVLQFLRLELIDFLPEHNFITHVIFYETMTHRRQNNMFDIKKFIVKS